MLVQFLQASEVQWYFNGTSMVLMVLSNTTHQRWAVVRLCMVPCPGEAPIRQVRLVGWRETHFPFHIRPARRRADFSKDAYLVVDAGFLE